MTDHFAVLGQRRRPWLDEETLKETYHRLTLQAHADGHTNSPVEARPEAAALNEAYRVLQNPKLRLQHLLALEGDETLSANTAVPNEVADLFWDAGNLSKEIDAVLADAGTATTHLAQSLNKRRAIEIVQRTNAMLATLTRLYEEALDELQKLDAQWDQQHDQPGLRRLHRRFSYLTRWIGGFREKLFHLTQA
jgi:curved DNA-binding protein CbpA